ncbi:MAG: PKD domain-containing protein [Planctomycetales bacterium]|nr:PKD domain-containing protein [Planctomycetales bacterium]
MNWSPFFWKTSSPRAVAVAVLVLTSNVLAQAPPSAATAPPAASPKVWDTFSFLVVLDTSASMNDEPQSEGKARWRGTKLDEVKRQIGDFLNRVPNETTIALYAFDEVLTTGPRITVLKEADRKQLVDYVDGLPARGKQTKLWDSLAQVLEVGREQATRQPGRQVRVLLYTDMQDNDPAGPKPAEVLARFKDVLREQVRLSYVSVDFTLKKEVRQLLESSHVSVGNAVQPEDMMPLVASFQVAVEQPVAGASVQFADQSLGLVREQFFDFGDGSPYARAKSPAHVYARPGRYVARQAIVGFNGERVVASRQVTVLPRPLPVAAFATSAQQIEVGQPLLAANLSKHYESCQWDFGDANVSTQPHVVHHYSKPGKQLLRLTVKNHRGDQSEKAVEVLVTPPSHSKPVAEMLLPSKPVEPGAPVRIADRSQGQVTRWSWRVNGKDVSDQRDLEFAFEPGAHSIELAVEGPGGTSTASHELAVAAIERPQAAFELGMDSAVVGDVLKLFDTSTGAERAEWVASVKTAEGDREVARVSARPDLSRQPSITLSTAGEWTIVQSVSGPGGTATAQKQLHVSATVTAPQARPTLETKASRGPTLAVLRNRSLGTVLRTVAVVNNAPPIEAPGAADLNVPLAVGDNHIQFTVYGPPNVEPSTQQLSHFQPGPLPWWRRHFAWLTLAIVTPIALATHAVRRRSIRRDRAREACLSGVLAIRHRDESQFHEHRLPEDDSTFRFDLDELTSAELHRDIDPDTWEATTTLEIQRESQLFSESLPPHQTRRVGEWVVCYSPD